MNNVFDLRRFSRLLKKTIVEWPVKVFGIVALTFIVMLLLYAFLRDIIGWVPTQNMTFLFGFLFAGCYLSTSVFHYFSSSPSGSSFLTLPASHLEKWLCGVVITWLLYVPLFLAYYKGIDTVFVSYYHQQLNPMEFDYEKKMEAVQFFNLKSNAAINCYMLFGNLTAAMFVGSFYFNRNAFIKTSLLICAVFALLYIVNLGVAKTIFPEVRDAFPFGHVTMSLPSPPLTTETDISIRPKLEEGTVSLPSPYIEIYRIFIRYGLGMVLIITAYIRLKEKEF
jgi:hypothetical protein